MRRLGMLCIGVALAIAGCGENGKRAADVVGAKVRLSGAGYSFDLPAGYGRVDKTAKRHAELVKSVAKGGLPVPVNVDEAMWGDKQAKQPVVVFVIVQPLTADTPTDEFLDANEQQLKAQYPDAVPVTEPARLGDAAAHGMRYESPKGILNHTVFARKGDYAYIVNFSAYDDYQVHLDAVANRVARSWSYDPPDAEGKALLDGLQDFRGTGYELRLPLGWVAYGKYTSSGTGDPVTSDGRFFGHLSAGVNTTIGVGTGPVDSPSLDAAIAEVMREERAGSSKVDGAASLYRGRKLTLDGEPAQALELTFKYMGHTFREREVIALRKGNITRVTLGAAPDRFAEEARHLDALLHSWHWTD